MENDQNNEIVIRTAMIPAFLLLDGETITFYECQCEEPPLRISNAQLQHRAKLKSNNKEC